MSALYHSMIESLGSWAHMSFKDDISSTTSKEEIKALCDYYAEELKSFLEEEAFSFQRSLKDEEKEI